MDDKRKRNLEVAAESSTVDTSAYHAEVELHYGRMDWLAEHIKRSNFHIDPLVARKILALIERTDPNLFFQLQTVRRSDLPPALQDAQLVEHRNFELALEVARLGGFKRGHGKRVYPIVGKAHGLNPDYVYRCAKPYRKIAEATIEEEQSLAAIDRGEIDNLGRPISPN